MVNLYEKRCRGMEKVDFKNELLDFEFRSIYEEVLFDQLIDVFLKENTTEGIF